VIPISVVIPVYNGDRTIKETIESVLAQTLSDFELIIINDGSDDATLAVISQISDDRIQVFSYPNAGENASRNRGVSQSCGEFIAFLDADDLWTNDKLEAQLQALQTHPQAALAYSFTDRIDEAGNFLRRGSYIAATGNVYAQLLLLDFLENGSTPLVRRAALRQVGGFDESLSHGGDWDLWLRFAACYEFVVVARPQVLYRTSTRSASANVLKMEEQVFKVIDRAFAEAPESLQHLKSASIANLYKYLTHKALEGVPQQKQGMTAARFLARAIAYDPSLIKARITVKLLLKIAAIILMPSSAAEVFLARAKWLVNTDALLGYIQTEPFKMRLP
jgi:glycosyltransferase involved in cell wall biosynthesis